MSFFKNFITNKKEVSQKQILNEVYSRFSDENPSSYFVQVKQALTRYENSYIWKYAQNEIIYSLLKDYKVYILIEDKEFAEIYSDFGNYQTINLQTFDSRQNEQNKNILVVYLDEYNCEIVLDMIESTNIWSYAGIISMYGFTDVNYADAFSRIASKSDLINNSKIKIEPSGDGLGLIITANNDVINKGIITENVKKALAKYSIALKEDIYSL